MMASAGITALLKKMDYKDVTIAIDGSLFRSFSYIRVGKYIRNIVVKLNFPQNFTNKQTFKIFI